MTFRVGQKVVCVSDKVGGGFGDEVEPVVGNVYTIRFIETDRPGGIYPIGLMFEEIRNAPRLYTGYDSPSEASFRATRFRPIVERKTDISIFTAMLTPKKTRVRA